MKVAYTAAFVRLWNKLPKDVQDESIEKIKKFKKNPREASLRTHILKGRLKGFLAFSVNYSYRIVFKIIDDEAIFHEIGNHDVYK